jgi:hypothetical protein
MPTEPLEGQQSLAYSHASLPQHPRRVLMPAVLQHRGVPRVPGLQQLGRQGARDSQCGLSTWIPAQSARAPPCACDPTPTRSLDATHKMLVLRDNYYNDDDRNGSDSAPICR